MYRVSLWVVMLWCAIQCPFLHLTGCCCTFSVVAVDWVACIFYSTPTLPWPSDLVGIFDRYVDCVYGQHRGRDAPSWFNDIESGFAIFWILICYNSPWAMDGWVVVARRLNRIEWMVCWTTAVIPSHLSLAMRKNRVSRKSIRCSRAPNSAMVVLIIIRRDFGVNWSQDWDHII